MSKVPKFIIWNDSHLGIGNEDAVIISVKHLINKMHELGLKTLIHAGDFFHSRSNQTESVLSAANEIFKLINEAGIRHILTVGNHDKTSYFSHSSFLDSFKHHPGVEIYSNPVKLEIEGIDITLIPFFDDSILVPLLDEAEGGELLISHFDMQGSTHLGKVCEKTSITKKTVKKWKKVYLGHYHNHHEISKDITHLPSLRQSSFGEDDKKGFSVIYSDLSYEIIPGVFKKFNKLVLNIDELTNDEIKGLISLHSNSKDTIRFEFIGEETKLKSIDKEQFIGTGIDVKLKFQKKYKLEDTEKPVLIKKFDKGQVEESFKEFCEEKDYDYKEGVVMLNEFLNKTK